MQKQHLHKSKKKNIQIPFYLILVKSYLLELIMIRKVKYINVSSNLLKNNFKYKELQIHFSICNSSLINILYNTLLPFAVSLNFIPNSSDALLHINILPRKISKYSHILQISSSICKFRVITFFSRFNFTVAFVTA